MSRAPRRTLAHGHSPVTGKRGYRLEKRDNNYYLWWHDGSGYEQLVARASERRFLAVPVEPTRARRRNP